MHRASLAAALGILSAIFGLKAQEPVFRSTAPLVVAHTTVKDAHGRYVDGLEAEDFRLLVDGAPVRFDLDFSYVPISLVIVVENCGDCGAAIKKIRKVGALIQPLITGERGEAALVSYSDRVHVLQGFERGTNIAAALSQLRPSGNGAVLYDALTEAVTLLTPRLRGRRGVILHIGEKMDRGSERTMEETANLIERSNIVLYSLTYSRLRSAFTDREAWKDRTDESEFRDKPDDGIMRTPPATAPYGLPGPPEPHSTGAVVMGQGAAPGPEPLSGPNPRGDANLLGIFDLLRDAAGKNITRELARLSGGMEGGFNQQGALERAISAIGEELHSQYLLSFPAVGDNPDHFHQIEIQVRDNPSARIRTRPGYWLVRSGE
ncbi:MAG: VWA domain-containing protein [Bryobacterales bacterium]|nr:VWA domain-containing protein [Bryobacterales bacterium]